MRRIDVFRYYACYRCSTEDVAEDVALVMLLIFVQKNDNSDKKKSEKW